MLAASGLFVAMSNNIMEKKNVYIASDETKLKHWQLYRICDCPSKSQPSSQLQFYQVDGSLKS